MLVDPTEDLGSVDLAKHDVRPTHARQTKGHAPAIDVEQRQGVQIDVAVGHAEMEREGHGVDPQVPVGQLHTLGPSRGPRGVVDGGGGRLVSRPGLGGASEAVDEVVIVAEHHHSGVPDPRHVVDELGVDEEHRGTGVRDDVGDLLLDQPKVDRYQHAARPADPEE